MALVLSDVSVALSGQMLLKPFTLTIKGGEIVTLMGPSGSGKTSLLSFIAGDSAPPLTGTGRVILDETEVTSLPPERRRIGRLFQDDLLFPHMTVAENLMFGMPGGDRGSKVDQALAAIGMDGFGSRAPHTLSGGERARVSLMRTLLAEPQAVLLDEPFNKFDAGLRGEMRALVFDLLNKRKVPGLLVTHDLADAPKRGRVLTIRNGDLNDA